MIHRFLLVFIAVFALAAGPCDMFTPDEEPLSDAGLDCAPTDCISALAINVIRADNQGFLTGFYRFALELPDNSALSIECYYGYAETGLSCTMGDTHVLTALIDAGSGTIQIILLGAPVWTLVAIEYNNYEIGRRIVTPTYLPGGDDRNSCGGECVYATEAMAVESW